MSNRWFEQFQLSIEKRVVTLYAQVAIGSTGAPTLSVANSKGIASIARNSAGKYTLTLQDTYQRLMGCDATIVLASGAPGSSACQGMVVRSDGSASATPTVVVEFLNGSGTATELVSGVTLLIELKLKNSTV